MLLHLKRGLRDENELQLSLVEKAGQRISWWQRLDGSEIWMADDSRWQKRELEVGRHKIATFQVHSSLSPTNMKNTKTAKELQKRPKKYKDNVCSSEF